MAGTEQLAAVDYLRWLWCCTWDQEVEVSGASAGTNHPPLPGLRVVDTLCVKWKRKKKERSPTCFVATGFAWGNWPNLNSKCFLGETEKTSSSKWGKSTAQRKTDLILSQNGAKGTAWRKKHPESCSVCYRYPCCSFMDVKLRSTTVAVLVNPCLWHLFVQNSGVPLKLYHPCLPLWDFSNQACTPALTPKPETGFNTGVCLSKHGA